MFLMPSHSVWILVAGFFYVLIACLSAGRTYEEGRTSKEGDPVWRAIGLLLCAAWPVLIVLVGIEVLRRRKH